MARVRYFLILPIFMITVFFVIIFMYIFNKYNWQIRRVWARLHLKLLGAKLKIIGKPDLSADLLVINHQSLVDIMVLEAIYERDIAWVAKKEIADIPLYGHILKAPDMIIIDRQDKRGLVKLINDVKKQLEKNRPIAMFPEGTRGKGKRLLKFKSGAKIVAEKFNLKVQPIILTNTRRVLDSKNFTNNSEIIKVIFLDSVEVTKEYDWFELVEEKMNDVFNKEKSLRDI